MLLLALNAVVPVAWAQSTFGSIIGTVLDSSGRVVAGAEVTLTATDTNVQRVTQSRENGLFEFTNLVPSHYKVQVKASGFETVSTPEFYAGGPVDGAAGRSARTGRGCPPPSRSPPRW